MTETFALNARGVRFGYGKRAVLEGIDLTVQRGEMVALAGVNGSGKSTLLRLLAGVHSPWEGEVHCQGTSHRKLPPRERARLLAWVPQELSAPFAFTVREWVGLGRTAYLDALGRTGAADREAVERSLRETELESLADRAVTELSGGERQRAALALALAQETPVLVLDEPTSHLDLHHQAALLGLLARLNVERGLTIVAALHDLNLAAIWFSRLVLLHQGRILVDGPPGQVLQPARLHEVFQARLSLLPHPTLGVPQVLPNR